MIYLYIRGMKNLIKVIKIVFFSISLFVVYASIVVYVFNEILVNYISKQLLEVLMQGLIGFPSLLFIIWLFKKIRFELLSETKKKDLLEKEKQIDAEKEKKKRYANMSPSMIRREENKKKEN